MSAFKLKEHQQFMNGVIMNRDHPDTFEIPSDEEKAAIFPGDFVKVGFLTDARIGAERMWLEVTGIRDDGWIHGKLNNDPVIVSHKIGDEFTVHRDHVLSIINGGSPA